VVGYCSRPQSFHGAGRARSPAPPVALASFLCRPDRKRAPELDVILVAQQEERIRRHKEEKEDLTGESWLERLQALGNPMP